MDGYGFRSIGIIIQSSTLFVALSALLGRIYFLAYYQTLGIPTSEIRLNVMDYSLISPDTTILGIGISGMVAYMVWWREPLSLYGIWGKKKAFIVIGLFVGSLVIVVLGALAVSIFPYLVNIGVIGVVMLLCMVLLSAGSALIHSAVRPWVRENLSRFGTSAGSLDDSQNTLHNLSVLLFVMASFAILAMVLMATTTSAQIGRINAMLALQSSPEATIILDSLEERGELPSESTLCQDLEQCQVQIVHVTDRFFYLQPTEPESSIEERLLHAVPKEDIQRLVYFRENS